VRQNTRLTKARATLLLPCAPCIQRLGDCIGKGAFGSVYKAFNWSTGEAVAIKQIRLDNVPKSELRMIEVSLRL